MLDLSALRQEYTNAELNERDAHELPFLQFEDWFLQAQKSEVPEPNAMVLATSDAHNQPHARVVLIKELRPEGFVWFTNYDSAKGQDLADNPKASLLFFFMLQLVGAIAGFWSKDLLTPEVFTLFGWGVPSFVVGLFAGMKAWDLLKKHRINYHGIVHGFLLCIGSFILFRQLFLH